jgi:ribosomal protein S18 acetylase RimI-like enzyme
VNGPLVSATAGDLHWWLHQHTDKLDEVRIALWEDDGRPVGWTWLWLPQTLFSHVAPDAPPGPLREAMLDWFEAEAIGAGAKQLDVGVMDTDREQLGLLARRGYALLEDESMEHMTCRLADKGEPEVPDGFTFRPVRLPDDLDERVAVHRAAFAPSRVTPESYRNVAVGPTYRPDLDWVAVAPDGRFAAFALVWLDERNGVTELEPVGTHPDFQRRGLARAVCSAGLRAARAVGAETGLVYAVSGDPSVALYRSLGFRSIARHVQMRREADGRDER